MKRLVCTALLAMSAVLACPPVYSDGDAPTGNAEGVVRAVPIVGRVVWPEKDLTNTQVRIYADPGRRQLLEVYSTGGPKGSIVFALAPGTYYLMAFSDQDGDQKASPGDGLGFYGVTSANARPAPFRVDKGANALSMMLPISMKIGRPGPDGRPTIEPIQVRPLTPGAAEHEVCVSGRIAGGLDPAAARFALLVPVGAQFPPRVAPADQDGEFELHAVPGTYHLLAVDDFNASGAIDAGDFVAAADYEPAMGPSLAEMDLRQGRPVTKLVLRLDWAIALDGRLRSGDGMKLGPRLNLGGLPAVFSGAITRGGTPVAGARVRACADPKFRQPLYSTTTDAKGVFWLGVDPATYYLMVIHDKDADGATGPGDELGFLGVTADDLAAGPKALALQPGQILPGTNVPLVMVVGDDTKPVPIKFEAQQAAPEAASQPAG